MQVSGRFLAVAGALATVGAVCFFALAADEASTLNTSDELLQKGGEEVTIQKLGALLKQQSAEDVEAAKLFAQIKSEAAAKLKAHAKVAALKPAAHKEPAMLRDIPKGAVSLSATSSSSLGGKPESKVDKLKAELAKAEAEEKAKKEAAAKAKAAAKTQKAAAAPEKQAAVKKGSLVTAKDFKQLKGHKALKEDKSIAKEAGLKAMDWMGSKSKVDSMLKKLHCDPTSFVCTGTKDEKKQAVKLIMQIQKSIMDDGKQVNAYGWKEEHALPPAPKM